MPQPYSFIGQGSFVNPASLVSVNLAVTDKPDWIFLKDVTNWGAASTAASPIYSEWFPLTMAPGSFLGLGQPSSGTPASVTTYAVQGTSGGFTFIDPSNPPSFASLVGSTLNDSTFVGLMANTGSIAVGDYVRLINPVGMLQMGGLVAQVTAVTGNTSITLGYVATAVGAGLTVSASATAFQALKFIPNKMYPRKLQVMYITQAAQAKVYFAQKNDYTPGELVDFSIPVPYGMTQMSYLTGKSRGPARVLTVTNSATESSIVLDIDSTGFSAFVYPASTAILGSASPPVCVPAGSGIIPLNGSATVPQSPPGTNLQDAFDNLSQYYVNVGLNAVGSASATMQWFAFRADWTNLSNA
jgi:hypothetical protein